MKSIGRLALAALAASLVLASPAAANHAVTQQVSIGPTGGSAAIHACGADPYIFRSFSSCGANGTVSEDGARVFFWTDEALTADDTDSVRDVYVRQAGTTTLVSKGQSGSAGSSDFAGITQPGGGTVFFTTAASLDPADTDANIDIYERTGSTTTLVSTGNGSVDVTFRGNTRDGSKVFLETTESLVAADTDTRIDVYQRSGGSTTLLSGGGTCPTAPCFTTTGSWSENGDRVYFSTTEQFPGLGDTDANTDIYEAFAGGTQHRLVSSAANQSSPDAALFRAVTRDGSRVYFLTSDPLLPEDNPGQDLYVNDNGVIQLVSVAATPPANCAAGNCIVTWGGLSEDETHVFFHTRDALVPADTNISYDLYQRVSNTTTLLTPGDCGNNFCFLHYNASSQDGSRVILTAEESFTGGDARGGNDVYAVSGGAFTLLTPEPAGSFAGSADDGPLFGAASPDATRLIFETGDKLTADDTDPALGDPGALEYCQLLDDGDNFAGECVDVYERAPDGSFTLLSNGPASANEAQDAFDIHASKDLSQVSFFTRETLTPSDIDGGYDDLYLASPADTAGYPRPKGATPMYLALVPAAKPCTAANRTHGPPLVFGSCNPVGPESPNLTVGVGDGNVALSKSVGSVGMRVLAGAPGGPDDSDVEVRFSLTNVMNIAGLTDYTGELRAQVGVRLTDRASNIPSTTQDFPFGFNVQCAATADTTLGGACTLLTTADAVVPGSAAEGTRAIWGLDKLKVFDGGPDGDADTVGDNSLFAVQGVFVP